MRAEALDISGIDTFYGDSHVLHGVSFALQPGRLLGLLGRNGAGKTTCMSTIMGFLKPRSGAIALFGEAVTGLAPDAIARKGISLVPQGRRMFRTLTVQENLMVAAQVRRSGGWTLDRVFALFPRLKEREAQVAGSLSGGEQQMLAIGRALMGNPSLLLLDEPLEGLAPIIVEELESSLKNLQGMAMLLVEQHTDIALSLTEDAIVIERGRIVHRARSPELARDPDMAARVLGLG
jgi:branched-chain amino acid transport system ATP-binding protein